MGLNGKCKEHVNEWSSPLSMPIQPCVFQINLHKKLFCMDGFVSVIECVYLFEGFGKTTTFIQPIVQISLKGEKLFCLPFQKNPHKICHTLQWIMGIEPHWFFSFKKDIYFLSFLGENIIVLKLKMCKLTPW